MRHVWTNTDVRKKYWTFDFKDDFIGESTNRKAIMKYTYYRGADPTVPSGLSASTCLHTLSREYKGRGESQTITPKCSCGWAGMTVYQYQDAPIMTLIMTLITLGLKA